MTTLATKLIIDSIIKNFNSIGKSIYIIHSGDNNRGLLYIKTNSKSINKYTLHYREYEYQNDNYNWIVVDNLSEQEIDTKFNKYKQNDDDCWCIEIDDVINPFACIL